MPASPVGETASANDDLVVLPAGRRICALVVATEQ
jgi:hypothetical protein